MENENSPEDQEYESARDKESDKQCPDHHDGEHQFIECDELPATCLCGKQETEV